jgi:hypothetical protein
MSAEGANPERERSEGQANKEAAPAIPRANGRRPGRLDRVVGSTAASTL